MFRTLTLITALSLSAAAAPVLTLPRRVPPPRSAPTKSLPLSEVFSRSATTANCLGNAFEMPGQAWHTDLTGGGVSLNPAGLDARLPTFEGVYGFSPAKLDDRAASGEILIVDRFAPAPIQAMGEREPLLVSHGALVESHLRALLESAGFTLRRTQPLTYGREGRMLILSRLDLSEVYATKSITAAPLTPSAALARALDDKLTAESKALRPQDLVLNMSFAMVPCQAMTVYRETRDAWAKAKPPQRYNFSTFLNDVARSSQLTAGEVEHELTTVSPAEPLRRVLDNYANEKRSRGASFAAVASSGNFGLSYPTAPAAFPAVISVGLHTWQRQPARDLDGSIWPDAADVNVAGEWFQLSAEQLRRYCQQGGSCVTPDLVTRPESTVALAYRGTSFAAPTLSLFLALQQGRSNRCFTPSGTGYAPIRKSPGLQKTFDFAAVWAQCEG
ncbi:MAG: hypothetical protein Q4C67_08970 [Deinococcus sp.]|nr:hypothetical protein [Deinococcus sp.]